MYCNANGYYYYCYYQTIITITNRSSLNNITIHYHCHLNAQRGSFLTVFVVLSQDVAQHLRDTVHAQLPADR